MLGGRERRFVASGAWLQCAWLWQQRLLVWILSVRGASVATPTKRACCAPRCTRAEAWSSRQNISAIRFFVFFLIFGVFLMNNLCSGD